MGQFVYFVFTLAACLADLLQDPDVFPCEDIPHFPREAIQQT